jgi:hypothetical protein
MYRRPAAMVAAPAKPRVERLQQLGVDPGDLDRAEQGPDVLVGLADVPEPGRWFDVEHF